MGFNLKFIAKTICLLSVVCCPLFSIKIHKIFGDINSSELLENAGKLCENAENDFYCIYCNIADMLCCVLLCT